MGIQSTIGTTATMSIVVQNEEVVVVKKMHSNQMNMKKY
jgi:hypothetical protein